MKNNKAKSFVTIMVAIAMTAFLLRIVIDRIIKFNIVQNESHASVTLKLIAAALDNYAKDNQEIYPTSFSALTQSQPPYLEEDYVIKSPLAGYNYSCPRLEASGYSCYATPVDCKISGEMVYSVTTGSLLVSERCEKKE